ncbi:MAG: hypothetical protein IT450_06720 [Phycisphaerales bacterium]|nr:hypothetical protein [Phycisphaerales bacterium]
MYPDDAGWSRRTDDPDGLQRRTLDNGILTLDGTASRQISDVYEVHDSRLALQPGERLVVTWRLRTLVDTFEEDNRSDVSFFVATPYYTGLVLHLGADRVAYNEDVSAPDAEVVSYFTPLEFHTFVLASEDYQTFSLSVDGAAAFSGIFSEGGVVVPRLGFGDGYFGFSSLSEWDFVEVSIVPEPSIAGLAIASVGLVFRRRANQCG